MAVERRAERQAQCEGRDYEPATKLAQHNAGVLGCRGLRQYIERGTEWLRDVGQRVSHRRHGLAATLSGAVDRQRRVAGFLPRSMDDGGD